MRRGAPLWPRHRGVGVLPSRLRCFTHRRFTCTGAQVSPGRCVSFAVTTREPAPRTGRCGALRATDRTGRREGDHAPRDCRSHVPVSRGACPWVDLSTPRRAEAPAASSPFCMSCPYPKCRGSRCRAPLPTSNLLCHPRCKFSRSRHRRQSTGCQVMTHQTP